MLIYKLRERRLAFKDGVLPNFPNKAIVNIRLWPPVPFGGVTGPSRSLVNGKTAYVKASPSKGTFIIDYKEPLFDPLDSSIKISSTYFQIHKNIATVTKDRCTKNDLSNILLSLVYAFPAVLSVYLCDAPFPEIVWGSIGGAKFQWWFEPTQIRGDASSTNKKFQEDLVINSWRKVTTIIESRRLISGLHYFHTACRLLKVGCNRFEFMSEALLNFSKVLRSIFGESRNQIRNEIKKVKSYSPDEIEGRFMPADILRNEFDVSHISLSILNENELKILHNYTNIAESSFRYLLKTVLDKIEKGEYFPPKDTASILHKEKKKILRRLDENIMPYCS